MKIDNSPVNRNFINNIPDKFKVIIPPQDIACDPGCLRRLAAGDRDAYAWVYKNYCKKVYDYAMMLTRNEAMSEDVVQEVFFKVWQHREKLTTVKDFNAYLYMLYRNHILDALSGQQKEISVRQKYYQETATDIKRPDEEFLDKEQQQVLHRAVRNLPPQRKLVYKLGREEGWKRRKIAEQLNISPFTVQNHMQQALRFLKRVVAEL